MSVCTIYRDRLPETWSKTTFLMCILLTKIVTEQVTTVEPTVGTLTKHCSSLCHSHSVAWWWQNHVVVIFFHQQTLGNWLQVKARWMKSNTGSSYWTICPRLKGLPLNRMTTESILAKLHRSSSKPKPKCVQMVQQLVCNQ